jgi:hypothetical protein
MAPVRETWCHVPQRPEGPVESHFSVDTICGPRYANSCRGEVCQSVTVWAFRNVPRGPEAGPPTV